MDTPREQPHPTYTFIAQEQGVFCVPAVTQMVLARRGIRYDAQALIFEEMGNHLEKPGVIEGYFRSKSYPLSCRDFFVNQTFGRDFDLLAQEALRLDCDVVTNYSNGILHRTASTSNHVSLITHVGSWNEAVEGTVLIDPLYPPDGIIMVHFRDLERAMFAAFGGLHIVHHDQGVLEQLAREFP